MGTKFGTALDFEKDGKQVAHLKIPHSTNASGWGSLLLPVAVIRNGDGPCVLFTGGNHGDEYEGPVALRKLIQSLEPRQLQGTVMVVPYLNYPAVLSGTRLSPVDGRNMNRSFPGDANGSITQIIADYAHRELVERADVVVDLHSGGSSMIFEPCAVLHFLEEPRQMCKTLEVAKAFDAPVSLVLRELDSAGMLDTIAEEAGKIFLSTELGGGGMLSPWTLSIAERGIRNLLVHLRILEETPATLRGTRFMENPEAGGYLMAAHNGLYEPLVELGESVRAGQVMGCIHDLEHLELSSAEVFAETDGLLVTRAGRGPVKRGDTIGVLAADLDVSRWLVKTEPILSC